MLCGQIDFHICITIVILTMAVSCLGINRLSCYILTGFQILQYHFLFGCIIYPPSVISTINCHCLSIRGIQCPVSIGGIIIFCHSFYIRAQCLIIYGHIEIIIHRKPGADGFSIQNHIILAFCLIGNLHLGIFIQGIQGILKYIILFFYLRVFITAFPGKVKFRLHFIQGFFDFLRKCILIDFCSIYLRLHFIAILCIILNLCIFGIRPFAFIHTGQIIQNILQFFFIKGYHGLYFISAWCKQIVRPCKSILLL